MAVPVPALARTVQDQADGTWQAACTFSGQCVQLGMFGSREAAARAADLGALADEELRQKEVDDVMGGC